MSKHQIRKQPSDELSSAILLLSMFNRPVKEVTMERNIYVVYRKPYTFFSFLFDCCLTVITGGLWLIWVFVREMRKR